MTIVVAPRLFMIVSNSLPMNIVGRRLSITTSSGEGLNGSMICQPELPWQAARLEFARMIDFLIFHSRRIQTGASSFHRKGVWRV